MGYFIDVLLSIPIGVLYDLIIQKGIDMVVMDMEYDEKIQKSLIIAFIGSVVGYILALSVFDYGSQYENRAVKYGMFFGATLLMLNSIIFNWTVLSNDTKLILMGFVFVFMVAMAYRHATNSVKPIRKIKGKIEK